MFRSIPENDLRLLAEVVRDMKEKLRDVSAADTGETEPDRNLCSKLDLLLTKVLHVAQGSSMTRLAKELALEQDLDRMIERALRRLGQIKVMKEVIALKRDASNAVPDRLR